MVCYKENQLEGQCWGHFMTGQDVNHIGNTTVAASGSWTACGLY